MLPKGVKEEVLNDLKLLSHFDIIMLRLKLRQIWLRRLFAIYRQRVPAPLRFSFKLSLGGLLALWMGPSDQRAFIFVPIYSLLFALYTFRSRRYQEPHTRPR